MRLNLLFGLFTLLVFQFSWAQEDHEAIRKALVKQDHKSDVSLSFINFQEDLKKPDQSNLNESAQLYGFSLSYNWRFFQNYWAYSLGGGYAQGYGVGGTKESSIYYKKRVPWQSYYVQVGGYRRLSAYFEVGPVLMLQFKSISWPSSGSTTAESPANPSGGVFLEFRQHLGTKYDLFQNVGLLGESKKTAWNFGFSFNL